MGEKKILDCGGGGKEEDIISIVDGDGRVLLSYTSGSGKVKVHPFIKVACGYCEREFFNSPLVGYCSCEGGKHAAFGEAVSSNARPELKKGRPFCPIHNKMMLRDAYRGVWVCDGCE